jgi:4-hydroxy-3-polyprenylbenzoate decarboxylase
MRLIVAMTGATGAIFGIRLLEALQEMRVETHLVISRWARATIKQETPFSTGQVASLATVSYAPEDTSIFKRYLRQALDRIGDAPPAVP